MKRNLISGILVAIILFTGYSLNAQSEFKVRYSGYFRNDAGLAYNFFTGEDAKDFQTTIKGFGSGFLLDIFTGRYSFDLVNVGWEKFNLSGGIGIAINKYRFEENIVFKMSNDVLVYAIDNNPDHDYVNTFFGYGKSKLVYGSIYFPVNLNMHFGEILVSTGGFLDFYMSGKHKRKFFIDDEKEKVKVGNADFKDYNISKTKLGVTAMILHKKSGINIGFTYMITPFFDNPSDGIMFSGDIIDGWMPVPELNEARVSLSYDVYYKKQKKERQDRHKRKTVKI